MWLISLAPTWAGETIRCRYELRIDDQIVGSSSLRVAFLPEEEGEQRLLQVQTSVELPGGIAWSQHLTGQGGPRQGFHAVNEDADGRWEVQANRHPQGLMVGLVTEDGRSAELQRSVEGHSLSWLDPGLSRREGAYTFLSAETGALIEGQLVDQGEGAWLFRSELGEQQLRYDEQGWLREATWSLAGQQLQMRMVGEPPRRDWGGLEAQGPADVAVEEL